MVNPLGREPATTLHLYGVGPCPPLDVMKALYSVPMYPSGSGEVVRMTSGGIVDARVAEA